MRAAASGIGGASLRLLKYITSVIIAPNSCKSASEKMIKQRAVLTQAARLTRGANRKLRPICLFWCAEPAAGSVQLRLQARPPIQYTSSRCYDQDAARPSSRSQYFLKSDGFL